MPIPIYTVYTVKLNDQIKYVGLTSKPLKIRINEHRSSARTGSNLLFHKAIRKYRDSLIFDVVITNLSLEEAVNKEKELIQLYKTHVSVKGYNLTLGGEGNTGKKGPLKAETKIKISLAVRGEKHGMFGKKQSKEAKEKMSLAQKNKKLFKMSPVVDNLGNTFESITAAAKYHNIKRSRAMMSVSMNRKMRNGLSLQYVDKSKTVWEKK